MITHLTSAAGKAELADLGGVSKATAGVILRELVTLQNTGADTFFGELASVADRPQLFSTFLMWLLADL